MAGAANILDRLQIARLQAALRNIQMLVHQTTPRTEPALHHFQRDFDAIRKLCDQTVGPYGREP